MLLDIVAVKPLTNYHLQIEFEDETIGIVNVATLIPFTGVFAPLEDEDYFVQVNVDPETGTIFWPNGADIDPDVLYAHITGKPIPDLTPKISSSVTG
jgi:hypothetical protein